MTFLLAVDPAVAYERIELRGIDHETLGYLPPPTAAYRSLPEYPGFVVVDANGTPDKVAAALLAHLVPPARPPRRRRVAGGRAAARRAARRRRRADLVAELGVPDAGRRLAAGSAQARP